MARQLFAVQEGVVEVLDHPLPSALKADEVRIRSMYSLVSQGTESITIHGRAASFRRSWDKTLRIFHDSDIKLKKFPTELGYSCVGKVEEIGVAVSTVKVGDTVWLDRPHADEHVVPECEAESGLCSRDVDPRRYTFRVLTKVALAGVHDAHPYLGSVAVVVGLGVVGQLTLDLLKLNGASKVYAIDLSPRRRRAAEARGAIAIDPSNCDVAAEIKKAESGKGADFAIETSASQAGLRTALRSVAVGGRVVTVSTYPTGGVTLDLGEEYHRNRIEVVSSMSVNECPHRGAPIWDIARLLKTTRDILDRGDIEPEQLITRTVPFEEVPRFYKEMMGNFSDVATLITYQGA